VEERTLLTWEQVSDRLAEADRAAGRAGYARQMRMLRRDAEAHGYLPRDLEEPGVFDDLARNAGWSERSEVILRKIASYAGLDVERRSTPDPVDVDPALTEPLRRAAVPPASPPEVRNTFLAVLVWHWPAPTEVLRFLDPANLEISGDDLLVQLPRTGRCRLAGIAPAYRAWLDTRAQLGDEIRLSPYVFCQTPARGARSGEPYSERGLRKTWTTHCEMRRPGQEVIAFATYRRLAVENGAAPVEVPELPV
jgi:hypothetical protein